MNAFVITAPLTEGEIAGNHNWYPYKEIISILHLYQKKPYSVPSQ